MPFSQIFPPTPSPTESIRLFYTSVSWAGISVFLSSGDMHVWNFSSCLNGVKCPFKAQEGRWDFSRDTSAERDLISP